MPATRLQLIDSTSPIMNHVETSAKWLIWAIAQD
jgi:hypothetical protein